MKSYRLPIIIIVINILTVIAVSQQTAAQDTAHSPEERASLTTYWMDQNLNLTELQYKKIEKLNSQFARQNRQLMQKYHDSRLKLARKLKRSNRRKERKLKKILNNEQWEMYLKNKKHLDENINDPAKNIPEPLADYIKIHQNKIYVRHKKGETYLNTLDIYTNTDFRKAPVVIFVHGGGWRMGDKRRTYHKIPSFVDSGYVFVSVNYRLSPAVKHPAHVQDLADAIHWVWQNIGTYGGDAENVILMGHSAGANMVTQVVTDQSYLNQREVPVHAIKTVIALDGAGYNITKVFDSGHRRVKKIYKKAFGSNPETWHNASPVNHIENGMYLPRFLLVHAGQRQMSKEAATELARHLKGAGAGVTIKAYPEENHSSINRELGRADFPLTKEVYNFIEINLQK